MFCKINLILWNLFFGVLYGCSFNSCIDCFFKVLMSYGFMIIVCKMCGDDIDVVCGQLVGDVIDCIKCILCKCMQGEVIDIKVI